MSRNVSAVSIARSKYFCRPPPRPDGFVFQLAMAAGESHSVKCLCLVSDRSYSGRLVRRHLVLCFRWILDRLLVANSLAQVRYPRSRLGAPAPSRDDFSSRTSEGPEGAASQHGCERQHGRPQKPSCRWTLSERSTPEGDGLGKNTACTETVEPPHVGMGGRVYWPLQKPEAVGGIVSMGK